MWVLGPAGHNHYYAHLDRFGTVSPADQRTFPPRLKAGLAFSPSPPARGGAFVTCWLAPAYCRDTILATSSSSIKKPASGTKPAVRQKIYGAYLIIARLMVTEPVAPTNWIPSPTAFWKLKAEHVNSVS